MATGFLNDGSTQSPRLEVHQAMWGMINLGNGQREWTLEEKFEKIAGAGFSGVMGGLPAPQEAARWRNLLDQYDFAFGITISPASVEEARPLFEQANAFGVQYVNAQVKNNFLL